MYLVVYLYDFTHSVTTFLKALNNRAHWILKKLSDHHGVTLSETIIKHLGKPFNQLPEEED